MTLEGGRHEARERALGLLYEADQKESTPRRVLAELPLTPDEFAVELVEGVGDRQDELDEMIAHFSQNWSLDRMPSIDLIVLRIATFELTHRPDVPTAVVIDEAVELAKAYSTDDSGKFVNGLLARIALEVRG